MIRQRLPVAAAGVNMQLRGSPLGPQGLVQQQDVLHRDTHIIGVVPDEKGRSLPGDLLLQGNQLQQLAVPLSQQILYGIPVSGSPAGHHRVAQHRSVRAESRGAAAQGPVQLLLVPQQSRAARQVPPGGKSHHNNCVRVHMVALPVVPHIRDGGKQLPLGHRPAPLGSHMISQEERGEAQPREPQGHRFPLPVGEEPVSAAGADDNGGAQPLPAQLRKVVGGVCNQLRGAVRIGDGQRDPFMNHGPPPFKVTAPQRRYCGWKVRGRRPRPPGPPFPG